MSLPASAVILSLSDGIVFGLGVFFGYVLFASIKK